MLAKTCATVFPMETTQASDEDLIRQARQNPSAVTALYRRYLDRVYRYLLARVGSRAEAEDLTSQVFLAIIEGLPRYKERGQFAAWLFSIARRKAADYYRHRRPQTVLEEASYRPSPVDEPQAQVLQAEERDRLRKVIAALRDEERELLRLRFAASLSFSEIAAVVNRRESAVKMSLYRLLERIQSQIEVDHA